jgi:hypothetical protein
MHTAPWTFTPTYQEKIMQSLHEAAHTVNFDAALRTLAAQARTRYAGEQARIDRGLVLALNGGVTLKTDGVALVSSQRDAEVFYIVRDGQCDCPDFSRAPDGRCKHRFAVCLTKRALQAVSCQPQPSTFYASYYGPDGTCTQGTAQHVAGRGWLFVPEDGGDLFYASGQALVLGGRVDLLEAQRAADGDLVAKICGYAR